MNLFDFLDAESLNESADYLWSKLLFIYPKQKTFSLDLKPHFFYLFIAITMNLLEDVVLYVTDNHLSETDKYSFAISNKKSWEYSNAPPFKAIHSEIESAPWISDNSHISLLKAGVMGQAV